MNLYHDNYWFNQIVRINFHWNVTAYTIEIIGGIAGGLLLIIIVVLLVPYRNWKYEQELDSLLWKVNYKDIQIKEAKDENGASNEISVKCNSKVSSIIFEQYTTFSRSMIKRTEKKERNREFRKDFLRIFLLDFHAW